MEKVRDLVALYRDPSVAAAVFAPELVPESSGRERDGEPEPRLAVPFLELLRARSAVAAMSP